MSHEALNNFAFQLGPVASSPSKKNLVSSEMPSRKSIAGAFALLSSGVNGSECVGAGWPGPDRALDLALARSAARMGKGTSGGGKSSSDLSAAQRYRLPERCFDGGATMSPRSPRNSSCGCQGLKLAQGQNISWMPKEKVISVRLEAAPRLPWGPRGRSPSGRPRPVCVWSVDIDDEQAGDRPQDEGDASAADAGRTNSEVRRSSAARTGTASSGHTASSRLGPGARR